MTQKDKPTTTDGTPGIFAKPTVDFAFKRIFGTERFKAATIGLLNSLLKDVHVEDLTFLNPELAPENEEQKKCVIDVLCTDGNGNEFIVEMQNAKQKNFLQRMVFYTARLISLQEGLRGNDRYEVKPTYVIAFLNFDLNEYGSTSGFPLSKESVSWHFYTREAGSGQKLPSSPEYHFYNLKNFRKSGNELADAEDFWLYLLAGSDKLADVPEWAESKVDFAAYFEASMLAEFTRDESIKYQTEMNNENDWKNALEFAQEIGEKKGHEKGKAEGKLETARNMKAKGYDVNEIADITGLSMEQIEQL